MPLSWNEIKDRALALSRENELWGDVFEPLKDKARFAEFALDGELGTVVWPGGAEFAPEFLYQKLRPDYALKPTPKSGAA
ncbi:MAG: DUF2442 domain-containing protein [Gammaproteobacteria bacterium]|nr:DUF2442 domain-containing protein [Gammaproteobacteria bacterium]